ncbi:MAG: hypothetical protein AAF085_02260, partial [Planctomycetota bacterium]
MRRVSILGATGSIGQNTIDLIARAPHAYDVVALTGASNIAQLAADARRLNAQVAVTADPARLGDLRGALAGSAVEAAAGPDAVIEAACRPADWVMSAIVGAAGLAPGLSALQQGATLALANKESLVCAGALMLDTARRYDARLLPVDSEHSAVYQALVGEDMDAVNQGNLILRVEGERIVAVFEKGVERGDFAEIKIGRRIGVVEHRDVEEVEPGGRHVIRLVPLRAGQHHMLDRAGCELGGERAIERPLVDAGGKLSANLRARRVVQ